MCTKCKIYLKLSQFLLVFIPIFFSHFYFNLFRWRKINQKIPQIAQNTLKGMVF